MYNPAVNRRSASPRPKAPRYGTTALGNACLVAAKVLQGESGHAVHPDHLQRRLGHAHQYLRRRHAARPAPRPWTTPSRRCSTDLKANGLSRTHAGRDGGEFGRTVGPLTAPGRPRPLAAAVRLLRGRRRQGGRAIGATNATGSDTADFGWSQNRYVYAEDIEATIYSALGIDWTTIRRDDPLGRGFEYVPQTGPFAVHARPRTLGLDAIPPIPGVVTGAKVSGLVRWNVVNQA